MRQPTITDLIELKTSLGAAATSQNYQDVFVLSMLGPSRRGYFAEVGAANGVEFSNTHLLEKKFGWTGILAEPSRSWHDHIRANRTAKLDTRCVWSESGAMIGFCQLPDSNLSTVEKYADRQCTAWKTAPASRYLVETVSLADLLRTAPPVIDYLSVDTEGSELDILLPYDFSCRARIITCEHNFENDRRTKIHDLLTSRGYLRVCETISKCDDWYVNPNLVSDPQ